MQKRCEQCDCIWWVADRCDNVRYECDYKSLLDDYYNQKSNPSTSQCEVEEDDIPF